MTFSFYELRPFGSSRESDFALALNLYAQSMHPDLKTNTNEITYWLDNYNKKFKDKFNVVGFYAGGVIVGFAEFLYMVEEKLILFDYLVVDERHRKLNVFFEFIEHLGEYFESRHMEFDYLVAEVGHLSRATEPSMHSQHIVRLLGWAGGRVVRANYYQPKLGVKDHESEMPSTLMLFSHAPVEEISREKYLFIVKCIYFMYYGRWYSMYAESFPKYESDLHSLYQRVEKETSGMKTIKLNGKKGLVTEKSADNIAGSSNVLGFVVFSLLFVVLLTFLILGIGLIFNVSFVPLFVFYVISLVSYFGVMALFSKPAWKVFSRLLMLLKPFSRRLR